METALLVLRSATEYERVCACMFSLIARPAASSAALLMRMPDESFEKLLLRASCDAARFFWALREATLVLMTSDMVGLHPGGEPVTPCDPAGLNALRSQATVLWAGA